MDWLHNLKMKLRSENKMYVLDSPVLEIDKESATHEELVGYNHNSNDVAKIACIMIATMEPELQNTDEDYCTYEMNVTLSKMFIKKARVL